MFRTGKQTDDWIVHTRISPSPIIYIVLASYQSISMSVSPHPLTATQNVIFASGFTLHPPIVVFFKPLPFCIFWWTLRALTIYIDPFLMSEIINTIPFPGKNGLLFYVIHWNMIHRESSPSRWTWGVPTSVLPGVSVCPAACILHSNVSKSNGPIMAHLAKIQGK